MRLLVAQVAGLAAIGGRGLTGVTLWRTLKGTTTPQAMTTQELISLMNDREEAHENCCDAFHAIEALQATETWKTLPHSVQLAICAAHASLGAIADGLAGA